MSFPRAKIHRFNEGPSGAPSPTRYDPKSGDRAKACGFGKGERERTYSSTSDTQPTGGTPFRTPFSVVKKHSCLSSSTDRLAPRSMQFNESGVQPCRDAEESALRGEIAEKTLVINEYQKLIGELKDRNAHADKQNEELEKQITLLETAKAELECIVNNNRNCEKQILELTKKTEELDIQLNELKREKEELVEKISEGEKNILNLEEGNVEYEKRILSLEGTLEQVTLEYNQKVEEVRELEQSSEKLRVSIDCLKGKIAMLENEVRELEAAKSQNEETIFGLEERASALSFSLEAARAEAQSYKNELDDIQKACRIHEDTITGLDMQLEAKQKEIAKLDSEARERIASLDSHIAALKTNVDVITDREGSRNKELTHALEVKSIELESLQNEKDTLEKTLKEQVACVESRIRELEEDRKNIVKCHEEENFHLQNEWETKFLLQMQMSEEALLEKEAVMKLAEFQHTKLLNEARAHYEKQLEEVEAEASRRQSAQLEATEMIKAKYEARVAELESNLAQQLAHAANEAAMAAERHNAICQQLEAQVSALQQQNNSLSSCNHKNATRLNNMLEEIKILNAENENKSKEVAEMTVKFKEEWNKNEKLSEHLGELDVKMTAIQEELWQKRNQKERLNGEVTKWKEENNVLTLKNLDLQINVGTLQDTAHNLAAELEASRLSFHTQVTELSAELLTVKQQCRKFEIAMADTRKSLEALGKRLIESENEVERLNVENDAMRASIVSAENDKVDADNHFRKLMEIKIDLEQKIEAAEVVEQLLRDKIKELELRNCDLELSKNELQILKENLEEDKKNYDIAVNNLKDVVNQQNLKMIEQEKSFLDHIEAVSQTLISKLEDFERFSSDKIRKLNEEVSQKNALDTAYKSKCDEFENLFMDHDILKTTFDIATKESQSLKQQYEEQKTVLGNTMEKLNSIDLERNTLIEKLETVNTASQNLAKELEDKAAVLEELEENHKKQEMKIAELIEEATSRKTTISDLHNEIALLKLEFEQKLKNLKAIHAAEIDQLSQEKKVYQSNLLKNSDEIVALLLNLETERKQVETLESSNKIYNQKIDNLQTELSSVCLKLEREEKEKSEVISELDKNQINLKCAQELLSSLEVKHAEKVKCLEGQLIKAKEDSDWKIKWEKLLEEKEAMSSELLAMTDKKDVYKHHCLRLEKELADAQTGRNEAVQDFNEMDQLMQAKDGELASLKQRVADLESLIGPFREQLEEYENERLNLENDRELLRKQHLEQAAKLGHQNHKQKIQHVVRLKNDILELRKENTKLQTSLKNKNRVIENLREELGEHPKRLFVNGKRPTSTPFKGKENDERMSPIHGVKQEAMSPSTALRDRNY